MLLSNSTSSRRKSMNASAPTSSLNSSSWKRIRLVSMVGSGDHQPSQWKKPTSGRDKQVLCTSMCIRSTYQIIFEFVLMMCELKTEWVGPEINIDWSEVLYLVFIRNLFREQPENWVSDHCRKENLLQSTFLETWMNLSKLPSENFLIDIFYLDYTCTRVKEHYLYWIHVSAQY